MNKLLQTTLISAIFATSGFAGQEFIKIDHNTKLFGDITIASTTGTLKIQPRTGNAKPPFVYTYGKVMKSQDSAKITTNATAATNETPANFYNGYRFIPRGGGENYTDLSGGVDSEITIDENVKLRPISVLRSIAHNKTAEELPEYNSENPMFLDLAHDYEANNPIFLISPTIEDQMAMTEFMGENPKAKLVSSSDDIELNIIMQGTKDSDNSNWTVEGDPFRDLKLSILGKVQGSATVMGKCVMTADKAEITIPTSLTSAEIDSNMTDIADPNKGNVKTDITINSAGNKVTFTGDLNFSSHGVKLLGNGGVFVCKKGITI